MTRKSLLNSLALIAATAALLLGVWAVEAAGAVTALASAGLALAMFVPVLPLAGALHGGNQSGFRLPSRPATSFDLGYRAFQGERYEDAVRALQETIQANPQDIDACFYLGLALGELRRHAEACAALRRVVEQRPRDATAHYRLSISLAETGQYFSARRAMVEAIRLDPRITRIERTLETAARWERIVVRERQNAGAGHPCDVPNGGDSHRVPPSAA